jgi:hypothetical protein
MDAGDPQDLQRCDDRLLLSDGVDETLAGLQVLVDEACRGVG